MLCTKILKAELKFGEIATNIVLDSDRQGFCDISKNKVGLQNFLSHSSIAELVAMGALWPKVLAVMLVVIAIEGIDGLHRYISSYPQLQTVILYKIF